MSEERQHRIASYKKGCRCDDCAAAMLAAARRRRRAERRARGRRPGDVQCTLCPDWFAPKGIGNHERVCDG